MQPDLPWNVAGIPPEAREAARAAARREGLSVGEWLTRKILRTLSDATNGTQSTTEHWHNAAASSAHAYRTVAESAAVATRDTEDMLARVSRSEDESQSATRRIEEHLKGVARRLDAAERSQAENNRAMSKAAAEINVAAREQAQAFDQLDGHVMALADRLTRVEQSASAGPLKDAVKGLHTGLSRLADQIADTANQSADQIATLAQNVESVAGRLSQARHDSEATARALKDHLANVDDRVAAIEKNDAPARTLTELRDTLEQLNARLSETETRNAGAMARLEESVAKLETHVQARADDSSLEQRLQGIEKAIADLTGRYDHDTRDATDALQDSVRSLAERFEASDRQHRRDLDELRTALKEPPQDSTPPPAAEPAAQPAPQAQPVPDAQPVPATHQPPAPPPGADFDLPPFPHAQAAPPSPPPPTAGNGFSAPGTEAFAAPPPFDPSAGYPAEQHFSGVQQFDTVLGNGFDGHAFHGQNVEPPPYGPGASAQSYIAATRRTARATADAEAAPSAPGTFNWAAAQQQQAETSGGGGRYILIGGIGAILIGALVAGGLLFREATTPPAVPIRNQTSVSTPTPALPIKTPTDETAPATTDNSASHTSATTPKTTRPPAKPAAAKAEPTSRPAHHAQKPVPKKTASISPMQEVTAAAKAGNATAETVLGLKYLDGNGVTANEAEAARWLERAANQGQPVAEYRLGTLYERGHGVPANAKQAAVWYRAAAKQGNRKAMHNLAVAYAQGAGVPKNFTIAAQWFAEAARLGLRDSQFNLAVLYERGMGVPQSLTNAYKWYAVAAAQGDAQSKARVSALSTQLSADDRAAAQRSADNFKPAPLNRTANVPPTAAAL